jgi:hypothetical protein
MNNTICAYCEYGVVRLEERPPVLKEMLGYCMLMDCEVGPVRNCTGFMKYKPDNDYDEDE